MNQQDKQLLLKDLCARLPYGVKAWDSQSLEGEEVISITQVDMHGDVVYLADEHGNFEIKLEDIKLCLLPLSSLTEEITIAGDTFVPIDKFGDEVVRHYELNGEILFRGGGSWEGGEEWIPLNDISLAVDLLNKWHIDYRGLIERGLAVSVYELDKNPYE